MYRAAAAVMLLLVVASSARAQVIYQPVQYQYSNGVTYYYGGNDPSMHHYIEHVKCRNGYPSAITGHHYNSLRHTVGQIGENTFVFSDCLPYRNAAVYGYTAADAHNEAMANMPLYFTKRDLLMSAVASPDGTLIVPASPMSHRAVRHTPMMVGAAAQRSEVKPRAVIILPRPGPKHAPARDEVKKVVAVLR